MNAKNMNINTQSVTPEIKEVDQSSTPPTETPSIITKVLKKVMESKCTVSNEGIVKSGMPTLLKENNQKPSCIIGDSLIKSREITYLSGSQIFVNDKHEVMMRKTPNLVMTPYECIKQLKNIRVHMENLNAAAAFIETVLTNWEECTEELNKSTL